MSRETLSNPNAVFTRRHDLDWLRIIAFGLLIFYHIGMFYVTWGWHVKSPHAGESAEFAMSLLNPWRLALLFFISGVAIRFLLDKIGSARFAVDRSWRLLPVIVFGMLVIVAPQTYFELRQAGEIEPGFWAFWRLYAGQWEGPWGVHTPTWNHLWYVVYLFVYCLILAPVTPALRALGEGPVGRFFGSLWSGRIGLLALLILPALPFIAYRIFLDPHFETTHNLVWDWANHAHRLTALLLGFYAAKSPRFWDAVRRITPYALGYALLYAAVFYWAYQRPDADWAGDEWMYWPFRIARIIFAWAAILSLLGLAQRFLTGDGPVRRYLTEAIFPYYILHQTIIVSAGYYLGQAGLGAWTEFALLMAITVAGCGLGFEIVKRIAPLRPLMGLKWKRRPEKRSASGKPAH